VLIAQSLDPAVLPQFPRLAANLASAKRLVCRDSNALADGLIPTTVHVKAQAAKFFFHLQDFKLGAACHFEFGHQGLQVLAKPPQRGKKMLLMTGYTHDSGRLR
jgi:hypothetical protein